MRFLVPLSIITLFIPLHFTFATEHSSPVDLSVFIDSQYAFDFNSPNNFDRSYTTQPARHNEFNINLAHIATSTENESWRARLALQAGTSVKANYNQEPQIGQISGSDTSQHIQEARIGFLLNDTTWFDAGIFFSHIGAETWISRDNLVLTRSLAADYSPYYLSGVKINHSFSENFKGQFLIVNGWQNVSENNEDKSIGINLEYNFPYLSLHYNNLIGRETSPLLLGVQRQSRFRSFHDFIIKTRQFKNWESAMQVDIGFQENQNKTDSDSWQGITWMNRYNIFSNHKVSLRIEHFRDDAQTIITTNTDRPFNGTGASLGYDHQVRDNILWRTELRYIKTTERIFPKNNDTLVDSNCTITTSLSVNWAVL